MSRLPMASGPYPPIPSQQPMPIPPDIPLQHRPTMRRKSSAQNLLSSFKSAPAAPPPPPGIISTGSAAIPIPTAGSAGAYMPVATPTTPRPGDWDVQSMSAHSDSVASSSATLAPAPAAATSPALGQQGTSVEYLRDIVQKRIITLTYMRSVHEGRCHWFHTIMMSRADLDRVFNNNAMKKRTYRFAILGMSLSTLLDIHQPQDLLRGMYNTLNEYDQWKEESDKPKMRLFKSKMAKRQAAGGFTDYAMSYNDSSEASYLMTPHMPFPLDYHQTLLSLLDVLSECYNKIARILGPSPFPHTAQHMMGPLGLLSPHPGVSYLFTDDASKDRERDGSLWGIANASAVPGMGVGVGVGGAGMHAYAGPLGSPPPSWTPALGESVLKIDGKFKKITSVLLKELDAFARNGIKDELASLDPLLRNVAVADDGREQYDFEGTV